MKKGEKRNVGKNHPIIQKKIKQTLNRSIEEGGLSTISAGAGPSYFAPFAIAMNATATQIGLLSTVATFLPSMSQLITPKLLEKYKRKRIIIIGLLCITLLYIPIILSGYLFLQNIPYAIITLLLAISLFYTVTGIIHPAWFSLMGSLVNKDSRGKYFAKRTQWMQITALATLIIASLFLDYTKSLGSTSELAITYTIYAFTILFSFAAIIRFISIFLFAKHYEPKLIITKKDHLPFSTFLKNLNTTSFGRFTIYTTTFRIATAIATPFFVVYILKQNNYSYFYYILTIVASLFSQILFLKPIGKAADKYGNVLITKLASTIIILTPITWALAFLITNPTIKILYIILFAQTLNGMGWAGYNLATSNYVYDAIPQAKRGYALSYMNLLIGLGMATGTIIGTIITKYNPTNMNTILVIFIISGIARAYVVLTSSHYLTEVRRVKPFDPNFFIHELNPLKDTMTQVHKDHHIGNKVVHQI